MRTANPAPPAPAVPASPARRERPVRDFGQGYGRSSGYTHRRYAAGSAVSRFRIG